MPPPVDGGAAPAWAQDPADRRLLAQLMQPLPLCERPFAAVGEALGLSEDEVIDRLRRLLGRGAVRHFGPLFRDSPDPAEPAFAALQVPQADLRRDLLTATRSGLPLLPRPYEAVGAMVGASGAAVRDRFAELLAEGVIRRIGAVPADDEGAPDDPEGR
ncbi:MAG: Lrp/AsnC family transcriptional regulator [Burkholderiaceae bacterium]|nr:Lrp/AsnC family transcriptional regulator [Burkholderiaceae bacterium]